MLSRITQRQLEYFVVSGESGSISAASERIHVSSPSISAAITHMEAELGIQLFIRHHAQGISLTAVGRQAMQEAKLILEQMTNLYTIASESLISVRGPLRVGCLESLAPMITPELVFGFGRAFPGVRLTQAEGNHEELLEKLRSGELDIALTYDLVTSPDIDLKALAHLPPYVMVGEYHPLEPRLFPQPVHAGGHHAQHHHALHQPRNGARDGRQWHWLFLRECAAQIQCVPGWQARDSPAPGGLAPADAAGLRHGEQHSAVACGVGVRRALPHVCVRPVHPRHGPAELF